MGARGRAAGAMIGVPVADGPEAGVMIVAAAATARAVTADPATGARAGAAGPGATVARVVGVMIVIVVVGRRMGAVVTVVDPAGVDHLTGDVVTAVAVDRTDDARRAAAAVVRRPIAAGGPSRIGH